ncbi:MAG: hypothetical protein KBT30_02130 [Clostridiales bacterium]|nr:hypothetical protein [Candidatus Apopatousia equi]
MEINKIIKYSKLFDIYGKLLTEKQQQVFTLYYFDDIGLSEIAELCGITKQAVKDAVSKVEKILSSYEDTLKIVSKLEKQDVLLEDLDDKLKSKISKIWED